MEVVGDFRDPFLEILFEEVLQFTGEFDAGGAAADDDHVQKTSSFLRRLIFEASGFDAVHDALPYLLCIANLFQKAGMFADAGDAEGRILSTDADDEHIKGNFCGAGVPFDLGLVIDVDYLALIIDLGGVGLVVFDSSFLVSEDVADRLHDRTVLDGTSRT